VWWRSLKLEVVSLNIKKRVKGNSVFDPTVVFPLFRLEELVLYTALLAGILTVSFAIHLYQKHSFPVAVLLSIDLSLMPVANID